ncbi:MAG: adenylate/guanylate cyclase domain-containing protein, partial [Ilumatobacteraceae bacterium]
MTRCPACAEMVPEGAHFCPSCGHTLVATTHEERRIVTVLFADLVGFTELAEFMDPEQAKRLVDRCFARLVDDITSFGGRIDKILGDGILALFGAPVAHEDDPERAVRAGLQMQKSLSASEEAGGNGEARIQMRVGINTGEVLVGVLAGGDYTAMGDVVNTAARLQGLGPPGRVIVGESTYALTAHAFDYEPFGSLVAKGRAQKVPAWLAVAATGPPGVRRRHRLDVPMVGRLDELSIGGHALQMAIHRSTAVVLSITGESGVGKRRLVDELLGQTGDDAFVLETECLPYGEANVYRPIATALAKHFGFDLSGPIDAIRSQLRTPPDSAVIHFDEIEFAKLMEVFIHLHGHPSDIDHLDPASTRSTIHWAITKAFERTATRRPTVLTIDNLHWADPLLIELLEHLVHALSRLPFVLVTAMRPLNELLWPPRSDRVSVFSLVLQPLSHAETDELARRLLSEVAHDDQLLAGLYDRSGGNPLFLQELAALTGDGLSADGLSSAGLPSTLRTLIGARLDQLTGPQRQVIDNAATLGTSGSTLSLQQFAAATGQVFDPASLRELDNAGLLQVDGHHWEFRSDSVRDAAYQTLTKASRAIRHSGVANAIRANTTALNTTTLNTTTLNTTAAIDQLAHHLATAAELERELGPVVGVPATIVDDAIDALLAASTKALETGALRATVRHTTRALGLLASTTGNNATVDRLRLMRANALVDQRLEDEAQADIDAVLVSAETSGDRATEGEARRLLGNLHQAEGRLDMARTELGRAVDILRTADRPDLLAHALRSRGFIELFGGSLVDSEWYLGEADAIFRELGDRRGMAWVEQHRAWILFLGGDQRAAHERLQHSAKTLEELGDRNGVTWV